MTREEELTLIKKERDEMEKHMTDMFDLAFMLNNRNDIMNPQAHYEKLSRMVTHYMCSIQQSYGYMSDKTIEALQQKPCDDCISRQAVLDQTYLWSKDEFLRDTNPFDYLRKKINSLPPAIPKPKTGHWIEDDMTYCGVELVNYKCDKCGEMGGAWKKGLKPDKLPKYCMNCGAKMLPTDSEKE